MAQYSENSFSLDTLGASGTQTTPNLFYSFLKSNPFGNYNTKDPASRVYVQSYSQAFQSAMGKSIAGLAKTDKQIRWNQMSGGNFTANGKPQGFDYTSDYHNIGKKYMDYSILKWVAVGVIVYMFISRT